MEALELSTDDLEEEALFGRQGFWMVFVLIGDVGEADGSVFLLRVWGLECGRVEEELEGGAVGHG